jgi:hypothetical protein
LKVVTNKLAYARGTKQRVNELVEVRRWRLVVYAVWKMRQQCLHMGRTTQRLNEKILPEPFYMGWRGSHYA